MTTRVWVDVGGTFTDCIVHDGISRRCLKVLSTGVVRAEVVKLEAPNRLWLQFGTEATSSSSNENFWRGASLSLVTGDEVTVSLGSIENESAGGEFLIHNQQASAVDPRIIGIGSVVEIDPHLEAPVLATRLLLGVPLDKSLPVLEVRLGTTRGTNALLTRTGAATALLVTRGFGDVLRIGQQERPDLFALNITKPTPLTEYIVEVDERLDAKGCVLRPIDQKQLRADLQRIRDDGIQSIAICFLHAHVNDQHERLAATLAREIGLQDISCSSEVVPLIKLVSRAETTTLDAYLNPILRGYVDRVWEQFGGETRCRLRLMTSNGNLVSPHSFRGRDSILSGPAGGVVALSHVARRYQADAAIGLDMGGTSTDVSRYERGVGRRSESRVSGVRVMTTMMDIQTVAAGGGSICDISGGRMTVGPASAGADPGPACYGRGGPLTVTDVNLLLGRLPADRFPFPLDAHAAQARLDALTTRSAGLDAFDLAEGFLQIAVTHMAEAVRAISTSQGSDVRKMTLVGFGGAAGGHLCRIADALQMERILDHPDASVMSALGMGLAEVGRVVTHGIYKTVDEALYESLPRIAADLQQEALLQLQTETDGVPSPTFALDCEMRFAGTESGITIPMEPIDSLVARFKEKHRATFGYVRENRNVEMVSLRCEATLATEKSTNHFDVDQTRQAAKEAVQTQLWCQGQWVQAQLLDRNALKVGDVINGPAMVTSDQSTLLIEPNWRAEVLSGGTIELRPFETNQREHVAAADAANDAVLLEVISRRLQGIADAMGEVLRRTAVSVNVKERRDYSCAVFRGDGSLIANAPHVPVHLGAMGHTVRTMIEHFKTMSPGDCYLSNDPFDGGSHLPDVTVVTPVFCNRGSGRDGASGTAKPDFFVASRAHHAEIGGRTPGSMPPDATTLAEEGVVLRRFALVKNGISHEDDLRRLLCGGPFPSRNATENLADVAAQQAAGVYGAGALQELVEAYSVDTIDSLMGRLLDVAGEGIANWISQLPHTAMRFEDALDDGSAIVVCLQRSGDRLGIDFSGTAPVHPRGFNATPSIVTAAVLYVLRCVSGSNLPLCDGVLRQIDLKIPVGMLNPPAHDDPSQCAAVVAGNVETSQRIVDVLLGALGVAAASQGTMNNLLIGDKTFGYYETIGGGSGATSSADGADAVHTHMTNTLITDPEVLESRLPVRLHRFQIRDDSGGKGKHRGGNGMVRELEFLKPLTVSLITGRRTRGPYGAAGGQPGRCGLNQWIRDGKIVELPPSITFEASAGDHLVIQTPGGGGWGKPEK